MRASLPFSRSKKFLWVTIIGGITLSTVFLGYYFWTGIPQARAKKEEYVAKAQSAGLWMSEAEMAKELDPDPSKNGFFDLVPYEYSKLNLPYTYPTDEEIKATFDQLREIRKAIDVAKTKPNFVVRTVPESIPSKGGAVRFRVRDWIRIIALRALVAAKEKDYTLSLELFQTAHFLVQAIGKGDGNSYLSIMLTLDSLLQSVAFTIGLDHLPKEIAEKLIRIVEQPAIQSWKRAFDLHFCNRLQLLNDVKQKPSDLALGPMQNALFRTPGLNEAGRSKVCEIYLQVRDELNKSRDDEAMLTAVSRIGTNLDRDLTVVGQFTSNLFIISSATPKLFRAQRAQLAVLKEAQAHLASGNFKPEFIRIKGKEQLDVDSKNIRFKVEPNGLLLYSVGFDKVDDGGMNRQEAVRLKRRTFDFSVLVPRKIAKSKEIK